MSDAVIIAHGKSEYDLFYGLIAWTDREPNLFARDGGRRNIAISHLRDVLTDVPFTSEKKLHESIGISIIAQGDRRRSGTSRYSP